MQAGRAWGRRRMQRARRAPTVQAEGMARAERTENMYAMSVTLDVSRLSGWLNAGAHCRVKKGSKRGLTCGMGGGTACGRRRRMQRADRPRLWRLRVRARAERTENMEPIAVMLDVSRLSGWLNADALCQVAKEA